MGQKCNPIGNRLGIIRGWDSMWYGEKKDFGAKLVEDHKIRNYLNARINKGGISRIVIERTLGKLIVTIHTSKPGIIIPAPTLNSNGSRPTDESNCSPLANLPV